MLSHNRLNGICKQRGLKVASLAGHIAGGGVSVKEASGKLRNWQRGLYKPAPTNQDIESLAGALGVEPNEISCWSACYRYAPTSPRKARLVAELIDGRPVQDALDVLKFEHKRVARMFEKLLNSAVANADEQEADVESLYVCEARVDGAGRRIGTKRWIPKDRGRAHPIRKEASHLYIKLAEI